MSVHRGCAVLRGERGETRERARTLLVNLHPEQILWVGDDAPEGTHRAAVEQTRGLLGRAFDAAVLDLHRGIDADGLGRCQGFVRGGGALVLRMPPEGHRTAGDPRLATHPYRDADVGGRFVARFERMLAAHFPAPATSAIQPPARPERGSAEQARLIAQLTYAFLRGEPTLHAVVADRGRGKSTALGLALSAALDRAPLRVAVTASDPRAAAEVLRFAPAVRFVDLATLATEGSDHDVIVVDEAAQLSVPRLRALARHHPSATMAFATTTRGYEGTGRGFVLRFLEELEREPRVLHTHRLETPIRWSAGDPVERFVFDALALDAAPARDLRASFDPSKVEHVLFDRDSLARDERTLRELFGLLVHAHYRTTPSDLHRLLDAPNLRVHALLCGGHVVAASLVALEGELPPETVEALYEGTRRVRGHALPETLICHCGARGAGRLSYVRSVRIATHPELRRRGLATRLVEEVHRSYEPDFFGTLFGATPDLLHFRRGVGYELVRLGSSRGARTGEPTAVMVRAQSARAVELMAALRADLARILPLQLEQMASDDGQPLDVELDAALRIDLPSPSTLPLAEERELVERYATGARTYAVAAFAVGRFVERHTHTLTRLPTEARTLIELRVRERRGWREIAQRTGLETVPRVMRATRRAIRTLWEAVQHGGE